MAPAPAIAIPKLVDGAASQPLTSEVTSIRTKELATLTGALANDVPMEGAGEAVTPVSVQALSTGENVRRSGGSHFIDVDLQIRRRDAGR